MAKTDKTILNLSSELFEKLESGAQVSVDEKEDLVKINVDSKDAGILIGHHGSVLEAIRLVLSLMVFTKTGKWLPLSVDINGWQDRRDQTLIDKANELAQRVAQTNLAVTLSSLTSRERRIVHTALSQDPQITTESFGEGDDRKLVIKPVAQDSGPQNPK